MKNYLLLIPVLLFTLNLSAQESYDRYVPDPDPVIQKRLEAWQDIKFGLLMHWGTYSQWGIVESWSICPEDEPWCIPDTVKDYFVYKTKYENLIHTFNPVKFDPDRWALAAKDAGMKYVVFTTKHHDGFCMFDTKYTDYKITSSRCPFSSDPKANITKEIFNAFRNQGLWVGAYFSKPDWHSENFWWPQFPPFDRNVNYDLNKYPERWNRFVDYTHNQVMELVSDYGKVDILWFDGGWVRKREEQMIRKTPDRLNMDIKMDELVTKVRKVQPEVIIVDRAVHGKNQNYLTPENQVPGKLLPYPWESCIIMGGGWSFSLNPRFKSSRELIHMLADIVAKGGNLLLNIGPGPDGTWYDEAYIRLKDMGVWLRINGEAIYGTRPVEPYFIGNLRFTKQKDGVVNAIYLIPENEPVIPTEIILPKINPQKNARISILGVPGVNLKWKIDGENCKVLIPENLKKKISSRYAITLRISGNK